MLYGSSWHSALSACPSMPPDARDCSGFERTRLFERVLLHATRHGFVSRFLCLKRGKVGCRVTVMFVCSEPGVPRSEPITRVPGDHLAITSSSHAKITSHEQKNGRHCSRASTRERFLRSRSRFQNLFKIRSLEKSRRNANCLWRGTCHTPSQKR